MRQVSVMAVLCLLLASCSADPEPRFGPPPSSPTSPTATQSSEAPESEPWEVKSKAGAVAFARHWVDVFNQAQASGVTSELRSVSTRRCASCQGYIEQLEDLYGSGGRLESEGWRVLVAAPQGGELTAKVQIVLRIARSPQKILSGDGTAERFPGGTASFSADLLWQKDGWVLDRLVRFV